MQQPDVGMDQHSLLSNEPLGCLAFSERLISAGLRVEERALRVRLDPAYRLPIIFHR